MAEFIVGKVGYLLNAFRQLSGKLPVHYRSRLVDDHLVLSSRWQRHRFTILPMS